MPKGKYLQITDDFIVQAKVELKILTKSLDSFKSFGIDVFKKELAGRKELFQKLLPEEYNESLPPYECNDLDQLIQNLNCSIDNIFIASGDHKRSDKNLIYSIELYLQTAKENLDAIKYERNKCV